MFPIFLAILIQVNHTLAVVGLNVKPEVLAHEAPSALGRKSSIRDCVAFLLFFGAHAPWILAALLLSDMTETNG